MNYKLVVEKESPHQVFDEITLKEVYKMYWALVQMDDLMIYSNGMNHNSDILCDDNIGI